MSAAPASDVKPVDTRKAPTASAATGALVLSMTVSANHLVWRLQSISRTAGPPCPLGAQRECLAQQNVEPPAQSSGDLGRDHCGIGRPEIVARRQKIRCGRQQAVGIVVVEPQSGIALGAKQAAQLAGHVTMIGVEPAVVFLFADRTDAALQREEDVINVIRNSASSFPLQFPVFGIGLVALPLAFIDFILVFPVVAERACNLLIAIVRVFGISLFHPNGLAGNHRCFPPPVRWVKIVERMAERPPATSPPTAGDTSRGRAGARRSAFEVAWSRDRWRLGMTVNDVVGAWKAGIRERARARRNQKPARRGRRAQYRSSHFAILHVRCTPVKH